MPAAETLAAAARVIIVTGFCIRSQLIGETDGPPGALALADAIREGFAAEREIPVANHAMV